MTFSTPLLTLVGSSGIGGYLADLAAVLGIAALAAVVFHRLRLPVVIGYLLAGFLLGPGSPVRLLEHPELSQPFADIGVILLMFSLGLEFNIRRLVRLAPSGGLIAILECSLVAWLAYFMGGLLGLTPFEAVFAAAFSAISSTTIIARTFSELGVRGRLSELVFGVLVAEDLIAILLLALLTALSAGNSVTAGQVGTTVAKLGGFLALLLIIGMLIVPRLVRFIGKLGRSETMVMSCLGLAFLFAYLAQFLGYSLALGSFIGGALVAESGEAKVAERLIRPIRDIFGSIFFVSVGMLIDLPAITTHAYLVGVFAVVVIVGKVLAVSLGAFVAGNPIRTAVQAGLSLAQIGEFSFIIAGLGVTSGATRSFLFPVAIAVSVLTAFTTPLFIRIAEPVSTYVDRHLPHSLQTFVALYGSWIRNLGKAWSTKAGWSRIRRIATYLLLDCTLIGALVILSSLYAQTVAALLARVLTIKLAYAHALVAVITFLLGLPFIFGAIRVGRRLAILLTTEAFPQAKNGLDLAEAPRKALLVTLELAIFVLVGTPLVALTQPFLPQGVPFALVILVGLGVLAIPFWKSTANLNGHVRAGAQVILETLVRQSHSAKEHSQHRETIRQLLPGMGEPQVVTIQPDADCVGKNLKELDLRGQTGATVLAIERRPDEVIFPTSHEQVRGHDVLVLTGSQEAVDSAKTLLEMKKQCPPVAVTDGDLVG